ncbi:MAG: hypothetical protein ACREPE_11805 [Lysobacter sp.]
MAPPLQEVLGSYRPKDSPVYSWAESAALRVVELCTDVQQLTYGGYALGPPRALPRTPGP